MAMRGGQRRSYCKCGRLKPKRMQLCRWCWAGLPQEVKERLGARER